MTNPKENQLNFLEDPSEKPESTTNLEDTTKAPLAFIARPRKFEDYIGQVHIFEKYPFLKAKEFPSLVLFGPPGTGKTTLAHILAESSGREFYKFNAVLGGVNDLKKLIHSAIEMRNRYGQKALIFIDEIHRFNKAQQDALLPYVEAGDFILIGATTENPRSTVNRALLSRVQIIELRSLSHGDLLKITQRANREFNIGASEEIVQFIADNCSGDARKALNNLEAIKHIGELESLEKVKPLILENARQYDRNQDRHYDVISAFIKSMRGSDPDAAILWLAVMLDGGEDPVFIARRLVIFASEDVGNADPQALTLATSALHVVSQIGMPEARISLAQVVTYLASTTKSNAAYMAINQALEYVQSRETIDVPNHLKNFPPKNWPVKYQYPHSFPGHWVKQDYVPNGTPRFYQPTEEGIERNIKQRLEKLNQLKSQK